MIQEKKKFVHGQKLVCITDEFDHISNRGLSCAYPPVFNKTYIMDKYHPYSI